MNIILEFLNAIAAMATILEFILERWKEYKHTKRMSRGDKEKTGSNRSF